MKAFALNPDDYKRNINPVQQWVEQSAQYLHKQTGKPMEECIAFAKSKLNKQATPTIRNPTVRFNYRDKDTGDSYPEELPLTKYLGEIVKNEEILAPSGTTYLPNKVKESIISDVLAKGAAARKIVKKEAFIAESRKELEKASFLSKREKAIKLHGNGVSGGLASSASVIYNRSGHSTLTSTIRSLTSLANGLNEHIIAGNRHLRSYEIARNHIVTRTLLGDKNDPASRYNFIKNTCDKYQLTYPTPEQAYDALESSMQYYFIDMFQKRKLLAFLQRLDKVELASVVYTYDLYHIRSLNEQFVREFVSALVTKVVVANPVFDDSLPLAEATGNLIKPIDENYVNAAHHICYEEVKGLGKDYDRIYEKGGFGTVLATAKHVEDTFNHVTDFLDCFFKSEHLPISLAYVPMMMRKTVVLSDTDSTCASLDEWVRWYLGFDEFTMRAAAIGCVIMTLNASCMQHCFAYMSANFGVDKRNLFKLTFKSEYTWLSIMTMKAKHYAADTAVREGNVYETTKIEIKGVGLKDSAKPLLVMNETKTAMEDMFTSLRTTGKISIVEYLKRFATFEQRIEDSLLTGEMTFYKQTKIKDKTAYTKGELESPYASYTLWNTVFGNRYGTANEIPYQATKVPLTVNTQREFNLMLESLPDDMKTKMLHYLNSHNRTMFKTLVLPNSVLSNTGMLPEVKDFVNSRKIINELCGSFYLVMSAMNYHKKEGAQLKELIRLN